MVRTARLQEDVDIDEEMEQRRLEAGVPSDDNEEAGDGGALQSNGGECWSSNVASYANCSTGSERGSPPLLCSSSAPPRSTSCEAMVPTNRCPPRPAPTRPAVQVSEPTVSAARPPVCPS